MRNLLAFPDESRVWVYQADRPFEDADIIPINEEIDAFCSQWTSHNRELRAIGGIMHDMFIVLVVDETKASTSGCSIDKSVAFVKYLEHKHNRKLLERSQFAFLAEGEQIHTMPLNDLREALKQGNINMQTRVFDNLVATRKEYIRRWVTPLEESWMKRFA